MNFGKLVTCSYQLSYWETCGELGTGNLLCSCVTRNHKLLGSATLKKEKCEKEKDKKIPHLPASSCSAAQMSPWTTASTS